MEPKIDILNCYVTTSTSFGKYKWFEGKATALVDNKMTTFSVDFPMEEMKNLGVCKNLGNWKAIRAWVDTPEGSAYISRNLKRNYFSEIRNLV